MDQKQTQKIINALGDVRDAVNKAIKIIEEAEKSERHVDLDKIPTEILAGAGL